jgi:signal transduction histidine kinase
LRQETFFRNAFAIGFLLVIILIIVIINRYQLKKRSEYQYKLRTEELETIDRIVSIINKEVTVQQLLRTFLNECRILFPSADRAAFAIHSEKVDGFRIATAFGYETEIPVEQPLPSRIFYEDWLRRSEEIAEGTFIMRFKESEPDTSNWGFPIPKARLLVTITLQNRLEGFIFFDNSNNEAAFEQVDLGRILRLREHAITAITKAKVLEEVERAKQIAEEQARTTSRLLGIAMTESNTLLKELTHHSRMLAKELSEAPSIVQKLQNIERLAQRILSVSESLFDIAVLEMKESRFDLVSVNIFNLAHQCVSDYEQVADQKNQTLLFSFEKEKHYLTLADPKWLRKAMDKIVVNAITFSPLGSKISVSVKRPGRLRFEVHDEGPGLTENDKQRMFELFHRLSAQPTGGESTLGMDLYIAKKIVDLHGGNLWAESEVGKGSTFIIELQTTSPGG